MFGTNRTGRRDLIHRAGLRPLGQGQTKVSAQASESAVSFFLLVFRYAHFIQIVGVTSFGVFVLLLCDFIGDGTLETNWQSGNEQRRRGREWDLNLFTIFSSKEGHRRKHPVKPIIVIPTLALASAGRVLFRFTLVKHAVFSKGNVGPYGKTREGPKICLRLNPKMPIANSC